jgi:5'-nucleotidase
MALGIRAIALSQALGADTIDAPYAVSEAYAPGIIERLLEAGWPDGVIMNLNFPSTALEGDPQVEVTRQGLRDVRTRFAEKRTDLRGRDYYWLGYHNFPSRPAEGTDLRAAYEGRISVTPLHIDLTHMPTVHDLKTVLGGTAPRPRGAREGH